MTHPSSCQDPNCSLSYRDHLLTIAFSSDALPTRKPSATQTNIREKRWQADHDAFRRLTKQGYMPAQIDGSALREQKGQNEWDVTDRPVNINFTEPGGDTFGYPKEIKKPEEIF
jgi:hypothetical protein